MKKIYFFLILSVLSCLTWSAFAQTSTFTYTGGIQTYTVPASITAVSVDARGACGGSPYIPCGTATSVAFGGRVQCYLAVSPGQVLYVTVGGLGTNDGCSGAGSTTYPGGFNGGRPSNSYASSSGGATDIRLTPGTVSGINVIPYTATNRIVVAGGGGGGGDYNYIGGNGGGLTGGVGTIGYNSGGTPGSGGTQTGPGPTGSAGALGIGAAEVSYAGGGGGYWGGNAGASYGGGGGGSSYTDPTIGFLPVHTQGYTGANGNGLVIIAPAPPSVSANPTTIPVFGPIAVSTTSSPQVFTITGIALTSSGNVIITPSANFQVSPDGTTWYGAGSGSGSAYTYTYPSSGFFVNSILYTRFIAPATSGTYTGSIAITGGGLTATYNIPVSGIAAPPCSGTPSTGTVTINGGSTATGNGSSSFTLNAPTVTTGGGISYQWQVSTTSATTGFSNISGANTVPYTFTGLSANSWYQLVVTCSGGGTATSATVSVTFTLPASSCIPNTSNGSDGGGWYAGTTGSPVIIPGATGFPSISDASVSGSGTGGSSWYYNNVSQTVTFNPGSSYTATVGGTNDYYSSTQIWIDFNDNGIFETSESVGGQWTGTACCATGTRLTSPIAIPSGAALGAHRMRVMEAYTAGVGAGNANYPSYPNMNPCPNTTLPVYYGDARDYTAIIAPPPPTITATPASVSLGNVTQLTASAPVGFFTISGINLTPSVGIVTVSSSSSNFLVSTNGVSWSSSLSLSPYLGGSFTPQNIYVQFTPPSAGSFSGNITVSGGSGSVTVPVSGNGQVVCSGTPVAGTASISTPTAGANSPITLSLALTSAVGGLTYQWQSSPTGLAGSWTNIAGAITPVYNFVGVSAATFYECVVTCSASGLSSTSNVVSVLLVPSLAASSCTPAFNYSCSGYPMNTSIGSLIGLSGTSITDPSNFGAVAASCPTNYIDNTGNAAMTIALASPSANTATFNVGGTPSNYYTSFSVQAWIDFNNDGIFQSTETVGGMAYPVSSSTPLITLTIPSGVAAGAYRMRVMGNYNSTGFTNYPSMNPCPTASVLYGNVRDYKVLIGVAAPPAPAPACTGTPLPGVVSASLASSCTAFSPNLFGVGEPVTFTGISYQWQSASSSSGPWTAIAGATGQNYVPAVSTVGTTYYRDTIACVNGPAGASTLAQAITLNAPPTAITGPNNVCATSSITLGSTPGTGTWTQGPSGFATLTPTAGSVTLTGTAAGATIVTYTLPNTCSVTAPVTVNAQPAAITGASIICGTQSTTLSDAATGGVWTSSVPATASVGSTGVVTGGSAVSGSSTITYTIPTGGCFVTFPISVNALSPITGVPSACAGFTTTLADATAGGGWSSTNTAVATVNSSGVVFGTTIGVTTIDYTMPTGCTATQVVNVTPPPSTFTMTGGGSFCSGPASVHVGINGSNLGISYQLVNTITGAVGGLVTGTGFPIDFGAEPAGTYYVQAGSGACSATMTGLSTVTVLPLPTAYAVIGGGGYCPGTSGVTVSLSSSAIGINYQLFVNGTTPVGTAVLGTGAGINFGLQTTAGPYTVVATNATTACTNTMSGSAVVSVNPAPAPFNVTGGGQYCVGSASTALVGLSGSVSGTSYQLTVGGVNTGAPVAGTGLPISFGIQSTAGVYNVVATITSTSCAATMSGTATIIVNPLPTVFTVTGGGGYCAGNTTGVSVGLNGSTIGISYQLFYTPTGGVTSALGSPVPGTGVAITFAGGAGTGGTYVGLGSYSVVASTTTALPPCTSNMFGSVSVFTNPLPNPISLTGGGGYCVGTTGVPVGLGGSVVGTNYQLFDGLTLVSAASGTGGTINFGLQTLAGTYTVVATTPATTCTATMPGSVTVTPNALPLVYNVSLPGAGSYCAGVTATGVTVSLSGSNTLINYQLYNTGVAVPAPAGIIAGTGSALSFTNLAAGSYTILATNSTTSCAANMTGSVAVSVNPVPTVYAVTGGGNFCTGGTGVLVGLSSTNTGINYTLLRGTAITSLPGVGGAISYGLETVPGTYRILATNPATTCADTMSGSAVVSINSLPVSTYTLSAPNAGAYCAGGAGVVISTSSSDAGISYQLMNGGVPAGSPVSGIAGTAVSFAPQTAAGTYTVVASNTTTTCSSNLTGSVTVTILPLPTVFSVTGGGPYCSSTTGAPIGLSGSTSSVSYQLMSGGAVGAPVAGSGSAITFGLIPSGTYTVVANNPLTGCSATMSGTATSVQNLVPAAYTTSGGGSYCTGGTGVAITLSSSSPGVSYQLTSSTGAPVGGALSGTGVGLTFPNITANGAYTVVATNTTTACTATMTGVVTVSATALPTPHTVTGGGNYCPGTSGSVVSLNGSVTGTNYQLFNGSTATGAAVAGTGSPISFGPQTGTGTYTVVANTPATTCSSNMTGSVTVGISTLPVSYNVTGGGNYCPGGAGVLVGTSGSNTGVTYQLFNGAGPLGSMAGTGFSLNFGLITASGTYTVIATGGTTGCTSNMTGTATVVVSTPPTAFNVTGGGNYCMSGTGVHVGLNGSVAGTEYQLYNTGGVPTGSPVAGTGSLLDFGAQTAAGTYTVIATSGSTTCTNTMSGSTTINILPLPTVYTVSMGGNYCAGGSGLDITLSRSDAGVNYQLLNGTTPEGAPIAGTGAGLDFGNQTAAGTYTIVGSNAGIGGCSSTMSGSSVIVVNALPTAYTVSGGGNYCAGGTGVHVTLSGSNTGIRYQLWNGGVATGGTVAGTGSAIDFGLQTGAGTYTVTAANTATGCSNTMTGSTAVTVNTLPAAFTVTASASNYCAGGDGVDLQLNGSESGTRYQLYNGSVTTGAPVAGTGFDIDFGLQTAAGLYTVVAMDPSTTCNSNMTGAAAIVIDPLPIAYTVVGGGNYCAGSTGAHVGISGSNTGISYQLYNSGVLAGPAVMGTGLAIDFGMQTAGSYTVIATNAGTTCTNAMSGSATVAIAALPTVNTVTGGGNYCAGAAGVHVGLNASTAGVDYQLYNGGALSGTPVAGTGIAIDFGLQVLAGDYTVMAINAATTCSSTMAGSAVVGVNSLPAAYAINGGGNYCPGGAGVLVGLGGSNTGISYQLYNGTAPAGSAVSGTGSAISFGSVTAAGTYTIVANNTTTSCTSDMSGTVSVGLNPLPSVFTVIGGGNYCATGAGVHVGVNGSSTGVNYQLFNGGMATGFPVAGSGGPLDFGLQTAAGTYTVVASNGATTCSSNMSGSATIVVNPLVSPSVNLSTGVGDTICSGHSVTLSTTTANGGTTPAFSWSVNGSPVSSGSSYSYMPANGDVVTVSMTSSATCATPPTVGTSVTLTVMESGNPNVAIAAIPGQTVCQGTMVTFNNASTFGGTPSFTWIVNGVNASTAPSYSYLPANGDVVYVIMNSNYRCRLENTVSSNHITMEVDDSLLPVVTIAAFPGVNISKGESLTLTASVVNGGTAPTYQWFLNGLAIPGANQPSYTASTYNSGDSVTCEVISSGGCSGLSGFNSVRIVVGTTGVQQVTSAGSDIKLLPNPNSGTFSIKGTLGTTEDEEVSVEISDMLGQVIYRNTVMAHGGNIDQKIQLNGALANGMYILNLRSASANNVFHVVIEQ